MLFIIKNYERTRERLGSFIDLNVEIVKSSLPEQNSPIFFFVFVFVIFFGGKMGQTFDRHSKLHHCKRKALFWELI
jgi:hypothetical protein